MKNILIISLLIIQSCNYFNNDNEYKTESIKEPESKTLVSIKNSSLHLIGLSDFENKLVIYNSCDNGNNELYLYTFNDSSYILLTGTQEDDLFYIQEAYKLGSDTTYFKGKFNYIDGVGLIKYVITDNLKGTSYWHFKSQSSDYSIRFVQEQKKNNFKTIDQPCKDCWDDDICEEFAKNDSLELNEKPIETIERHSNFWRTEAWSIYDYPNVKIIKENLSKIGNISNQDAKILIKTYILSDYRDKELKTSLVDKLKNNPKITIEELKNYKTEEKNYVELNNLKKIFNIDITN